MKRSEMLEIISDAVQPCNSTYKESRDRTAERILTIMEKLEMRPPNWYNDEFGDYEASQASKYWEEE